MSDSPRRRLDYVERKLAHWHRMGTKGAINPETGGAQPDWRKKEREADAKRALAYWERQR